MVFLIDFFLELWKIVYSQLLQEKTVVLLCHLENFGCYFDLRMELQSNNIYTAENLRRSPQHSL